MPVNVQCPTCGASFTVPDQAVGKRGRCKKCHDVIKIHSPSAASLAAPTSGQHDRTGGGKQKTRAWKSLAVMIPPVLVMMLGTFLPWMSIEGEASYRQEHGLESHWDGFNTVVMTKYDLDGRPRVSLGNMGITLPTGITVSAGFLIVICCACAVLVTALRRPRWAMAFGAVGVILGAYMFLRIAANVVAATESHLNVSIGLGIWVVLAGGVLIIIGGLLAPLLSGSDQALTHTAASPR